MRVAILGARGQLGTALQKVLKHELIPLTHDELNLAKLPDIEERLAAIKPDLIINCAAYNFVDKSEREPGMAYVVNALGPRRVAFYCKTYDIPFVHVSSDYVFGMDENRNAPYIETDKPGPLSSYGVSKLAGEYFVLNECEKHFVIRTCGLFGPAMSEGKGNFVHSMLEMAAENQTLTIVNDQYCTPTYTLHLAEAISKLIETDAYGLYHGTSSGKTTWFDFATEIFKQATLDVEVKPISSAQYQRPAARPGYSLLDCQKLAGVLGQPLPSWEEGLREYLDLIPDALKMKLVRDMMDEEQSSAE